MEVLLPGIWLPIAQGKEDARSWTPGSKAGVHNVAASAKRSSGADLTQASELRIDGDTGPKYVRTPAPLACGVLGDRVGWRVLVRVSGANERQRAPVPTDLLI